MEIKIKAWVAIQGNRHPKEVTLMLDIEDDLTAEQKEDEINTFVDEWANEQIEIGWKEITKE